MHFNAQIVRFWNSHPALLYGISSLLGFYGSFYGFWVLLVPISTLLIPFFFSREEARFFKPLVLSCLILFSSWVYAESYKKTPKISAEGIEGEGYVEIESLSLQSTSFGKNWVYQCHLRYFYAHEQIAPLTTNIKCTISLPYKPNLRRPRADRAYLVKGTLVPLKNGRFFLKVDKEKTWLSVKSSWSLAERRYQIKRSLTKWFDTLFHTQRSAIFLAGLTTGEFDDRIMQLEFARFGLQHIMAISGFHFGIIASILSFLLRFIASRRVGIFCVFIFLTTYFLFLGNSASILRAWLMIVISLAGDLFGKKVSALNSLGVALLVILMADPLLSESVGFQFSFVATAAILLGYAPINELLESVLPKRPLDKIKDTSLLNKHGYCLLCFFRQGLALALAINLFVCPLTLYYFHQFSWMSLFYNFFFPLFVSFSLFLLIAGVVCSLALTPLAVLIHSINNIYTGWILNLIYNLPASVDLYYEIDSIPLWPVVVHLCIVFLGGVWLNYGLSDKRLERQDLVFI